MTKLLLKDKTALITGASRGIGAAIASEFASNGANLILLSRDSDALAKLSSKLEKYQCKVKTFACDITEEEAVKDVFKYLNTETVLDILVNNAGIMKAKPLAFIKTDDLREHYEVNTFAVYHMCQLASRLMIRNQSGTIINMTSMLGEYGQAGQSIYAGSKAAITAFTRSMAQELSSYNIRVNAIAPGLIDTDLTKDLTEKDKQKTLANVAIGRMGRADEIAKTCLFLASDWSSYINGEIIHVDGGIHF